MDRLIPRFPRFDRRSYLAHTHWIRIPSFQSRLMAWNSLFAIIMLLYSDVRPSRRPHRETQCSPRSPYYLHTRHDLMCHSHLYRLFDRCSCCSRHGRWRDRLGSGDYHDGLGIVTTKRSVPGVFQYRFRYRRSSCEVLRSIEGGILILQGGPVGGWISDAVGWRVAFVRSQ